MKHRRHVDIQSLAPVVAKLFNKFRHGFGIQPHDVEDICGAAIVKIATTLWKEGSDLQDFFERMKNCKLTKSEFFWTYSIFLNECRNYRRGSTFYKHRHRETGELVEVEDHDLSQELLEGLTYTLDRIRLDYGEQSEEYAIALWLLFSDGEEQLFELVGDLAPEDWLQKTSRVLAMVRTLLGEKGWSPASHARRMREQ